MASDEVMAENAAANPAFKKVMDSYNAFLDLARPYGTTVKVPVFTQRA
jgi:TRAP-type mannitol/chloroaromatic compound transport system substrate-binding protein